MSDFSSFNLAVGWALFGLTWMVQLVVYPAFKYVSKNRFGTYHHKHVLHITYIVIPLMLSELLLAIYMLILHFYEWQYWVLFIMVIGVWIITATMAMPLHNLLSKDGKDRVVIEKLIKVHGGRTILWTIKAILLLFLA